MINLKQDGNYSIFINKETGYKHFYKDGKEDVLNFFITNGKDGLLYKKNNFKDKYSKIKQFINKKENAKFILNVIILSVLSSTASSALVSYKMTSHYEQSQKEIEELNAAILETEANQYYNFDVLSYDIKHPLNSGGFIEEILYDEEFIKDICNTPMTEDRIMSLKEKTTDIEIVYFTEEDELENIKRVEQGLGPLLGYYSYLEPKIIHVKEPSQSDTIYHEFIHLLQDDNEYTYIREACAEIISNEYFGCEISSYKEEVKRVQILMEIIGSEAVWNLNFSGEVSKFDKVLLDNLSIEEFGELYSVLITETSSLTEEEIIEVNDKFDRILSDLYFNIYDESIKENEVIQNIYKGYDSTIGIGLKNNRHYFQDVENRMERPDFVYTEQMTFQDAEKKGLIDVDFKVNKHVELTEEEYKERLSYNQDAYVSYIKEDGVCIIRNSDNTIDVTKEGDDRKYTEKEALEQGIIRVDYYYYIADQTVDYKTVDIKEDNIVGTSISITPLTDKYDNISIIDSKEIDGKDYYMVECINNIYCSDEKSKVDETLKSR